jgi:hypothetical protein
MTEVKIVIIEAKCAVLPKDWVIKTKVGRLVRPLAGGEYRRMIKNGGTPVHLYVVSSEVITGELEAPFYHGRLEIVDRYFDTHRAYKDAGELYKVIASTHNTHYSDIPELNRWYIGHFIELYNKDDVRIIYDAGVTKRHGLKLKFANKPIQMETIEIKGYKVIGNTDSIEGRGTSFDIAYTSNQTTANKIAKGRGVFGANADVQAFTKTYTLYETFEQFEEDRVNGVKVKALAKLTDEDKKALGL